MPNLAVGQQSTRLITLRGNSGSGKSTVAAAIRAARPPGTLAIVGQDVIRYEILGSGEDQGGHPISLAETMARHLLDRGVDVIIEGILNAAWYTDMLVRLVADHRGGSRSYIWKLPFDETVRRTASKPATRNSWERDLRRWWRGAEDGSRGPSLSSAFRTANTRTGGLALDAELEHAAASNGTLMLGVQRRDESSLIGHVAIWPRETGDVPRGELIIMVSSAHWRCGVAAEACAAAMRRWRSNLHGSTVYAAVHPENLACQALMRKIGLDREAPGHAFPGIHSETDRVFWLADER